MGRLVDPRRQDDTVVPFAAAGDAFQAEKPRVWSETPVQHRPLTGASFDLHPDGERSPGASSREPRTSNEPTRYNGCVSIDVPSLEIKIVGRRRPSRGGLVAAAPLLDLVIELRQRRPFIPKGVHRFRTFEESAAWSLQMMARPTPDRPA